MTLEDETKRIEIGQLPRGDGFELWDLSHMRRESINWVYIECASNEEALDNLRAFLIEIIEIPDVQDLMRKYKIGVESRRTMP